MDDDNLEQEWQLVVEDDDNFAEEWQLVVEDDDNLEQEWQLVDRTKEYPSLLPTRTRSMHCWPF